MGNLWWETARGSGRFCQRVYGLSGQRKDRAGVHRPDRKYAGWGGISGTGGAGEGRQKAESRGQGVFRMDE